MITTVSAVSSTMTEQDTLRNYGAGAGLALGAGIAATTAVLVGPSVNYATAAGYGAAGGLVVGAFAGLLVASSFGRDDWALRLTAGTLFAALAVGALLGALAAWTVDASLFDGAAAGGAGGGALGLLLSAILVAAGRRRPGTESVSGPDAGELRP